MKYTLEELAKHHEATGSKVSEYVRASDYDAVKAECLRLESCLASKTEIANQLKDGLADAFERETILKAERDAIAAQVELYKRRSLNLSILVDELIDHLRYNKAERSDVLQEFWDKQECTPRVPKNPQQALVEIRVEAGRDGYLQALEDIDSEDDDKWTATSNEEAANQYAEKIRQGGEK